MSKNGRKHTSWWSSLWIEMPEPHCVNWGILMLKLSNSRQLAPPRPVRVPAAAMLNRLIKWPNIFLLHQTCLDNPSHHAWRGVWLSKNNRSEDFDLPYLPLLPVSGTCLPLTLHQKYDVSNTSLAGAAADTRIGWYWLICTAGCKYLESIPGGARLCARDRLNPL